jgi:protein TonB
MIWLTDEDRRDLLRWLICGVVVVFAHAAVAAALIEWREPVIEEGEIGNDPIIVEFRPEVIPTEPVPDPVQRIEEKPEPLPEQQSEAMLPPQPKPDPEPPREETPVVIPQPMRATASVTTWENQIVTILEHNKRYPGDARASGQQGVARLAFRIDSDGHLVSSRIVKSSGFPALDAETLALVQRVQPFPPPPPERAGYEMILPLRFNIRQ